MSTQPLKYFERHSIGVLILTTLCGCATSHHVKILVVSETYEKSPDPTWTLPRAQENATRVLTALKSLSTAKGLQAVQVTSLTSENWHNAINEFTHSLTKQDYAVIYISSHGGQDTASKDAALLDVSGHPIKLTHDLQTIANHAYANIFFLDICRRGNEESTVPHVDLTGRASIVVFSTDPYRNAGDGPTFSKAVAEEIPKKQELRITLQNIIQTVIHKSSKTPDEADYQDPWTYGQIPWDVYLAGEPPKPGTGP